MKENKQIRKACEECAHFSVCGYKEYFTDIEERYADPDNLDPPGYLYDVQLFRASKT